VGLALRLRHVWTLLHRQALAQRRRGEPRLHRELLPLQDLLDWIAEVLKRLLGFREEIQTPHAFIL
jgi:hypothetical protein